LERPKVEVIPKSTITYRPTINRSGKPTTTVKKSATTTYIADDDEGGTDKK
jgi:hypothetical protein